MPRHWATAAAAAAAALAVLGAAAWRHTTTVIVELQQHMPATPQGTLAFYYDMSNHKRLHQFMHSMEVEPFSPRSQAFKAVERVPLAPGCTMDLTMQGTMEVVDDGSSGGPPRIQIIASGWNVDLEHQVVFHAGRLDCNGSSMGGTSPGTALLSTSTGGCSEGCTVLMRIKFRCPLLVAPITRAQAAAAHKRLLAGMAQMLQEAAAEAAAELAAS